MDLPLGYPTLYHLRGKSDLVFLVEKKGNIWFKQSPRLWNATANVFLDWQRIQNSKLLNTYLDMVWVTPYYLLKFMLMIA